MWSTRAGASSLQWLQKSRAASMAMRTVGSAGGLRRDARATYSRTASPHKGAPTLESVKSLKYDYKDMPNDSLVTIAAMDNPIARGELLKRHIMVVDQIEYEEACKQFEIIAASNRKGMLLASIPYQVGALGAMTAAFVSVPLVFDLNTAIWFNEAYVTTDVPEPRDLETALEVGSWTWNWMEPPLGQISFFLLCLQFSRAQMEHLGIRPYTMKLKEMRAAKLSRTFPQYDSKLVEAYSLTDPILPTKKHW